MRQDVLRTVLAEESRAYGFTLAFWGSGTLLVGQFGLPSLVEVLLYTGGALLGFGAMSLVAFRDAFGTVKKEDGDDYLVLSMVHFIASLAPILLTGLVFLRLDAVYGYLLSGFSISTVYNLSIPLEERISRKAMKVEQRLIDF